MASALISALQKAKPIVEENSIVIEMKELKIKLKKEEFIESLFIQYQTLIEAEIEEDKTSVMFDTDYAGNISGNNMQFVIQDTQNEAGKESIFAFIGFYPESEMKESDDVPPHIEEIVHWEELKVWCEYVLCTNGKIVEVLSLEEKVRKEQEQYEVDCEERAKKTTAWVGDISIYPNSSIDYHSVWLATEEGNIMIPIEFLDLHDISYFIEEESYTKEEVIHSVYRDSVDEYVVLSWEEDELQLKFVTKEKQHTAKLSVEKAQELQEQIEVILKHGI